MLDKMWVLRDMTRVDRPLTLYSVAHSGGRLCSFEQRNC